MFGYATFYMKFVPTEQTQPDDIYCANLTFDFSKTLTEDSMGRFLEKFKNAVEEKTGRKFVKAPYITKEEYEVISSKNMEEERFSF